MAFWGLLRLNVSFTLPSRPFEDFPAMEVPLMVVLLMLNVLSSYELAMEIEPAELY